MRKRTPFSRPQSMGQILDQSFGLYRNNLGALLTTAAILLLPLGILNTLLTGATFLDRVGGFGGIGNIPVSSSAVGGVSTILSIIAGIATTITTLALTYHVARLLKGHEATSGESLRAGRGRFWTYFRLNLLQAGAAAGLMLGAGLLFLVLGFLGGDSAIGIVLMVLLGIALFCAFVFVMTRWSMALPALVEKRLSATEALNYSWELTEGRIGRCILFGILVVFLSLIVLILPATLLALFSLVFAETPEILVTIISTIEIVFNILWLPLQMAAYVIFYFDLRVRKEGYDLTQRLDALEAEASPAYAGSI